MIESSASFFGPSVAILRARSCESATASPLTDAHDIAVLEAGRRRRRILLDLRDERALGVLEVEAVGDILRHRLDLHAEPAARDLAVVLQLLHDALGDVARDGEADADAAARRREDRGVDADHLALGVEGRAAGIAVVHRRVDLQEVVVGAGADVAAARRDDARRHRAAEAERIADRDHPVADARRLRGERDIGIVRAFLDLEQREVGLRIRADDAGGNRSCRRRW